MFYEFQQNNSGGVFVDDAEAGLSHWVIVEADSADEANALAERVGLYFGGDGDCPCCGDRWYEQWRDDAGTAEPSIYGRVIRNGKPEEAEGFRDWKWMTGPEGYIHYKDGRVEPFDL